MKKIPLILALVACSVASELDLILPPMFSAPLNSAILFQKDEMGVEASAMYSGGYYPDISVQIPMVGVDARSGDLAWNVDFGLESITGASATPFVALGGINYKLGLMNLGLLFNNNYTSESGTSTDEFKLSLQMGIITDQMTFLAQLQVLDNLSISDGTVSSSADGPKILSLGVENHQGNFNPGAELQFVFPANGKNLGVIMGSFVKLSPTPNLIFDLVANYGYQSDTTSANQSSLGVGLSIEYKFTPQCGVNVGYGYSSVSETYSDPDIENDSYHINTLMAGLKLHF